MKRTPMPPRRAPMKRSSPKRAQRKEQAPDFLTAVRGARDKLEAAGISFLDPPAEPVHSTVERTLAAPLPKDGRLESETYRAFVRRLVCAFCGEPSPSECHHYPPRGRLGTVVDIWSAPACRRCHMRCEGITVEGKPPVPETEQAEAVRRTWDRFVRECSHVEWLQVSREVGRWKEGRVFVPPSVQW